MVRAQQVEESRLRRKNREVKRAKSYKSGSSKRRLEIQDNPRFNKRFSNLTSFKFHKACADRVSNPKSQKGRGTSSPTKKPTCGKGGKKYYGDYLIVIDNCFGCGKSGHKVKD